MSSPVSVRFHLLKIVKQTKEKKASKKADAALLEELNQLEEEMGTLTETVSELEEAVTGLLDGIKDRVDSLLEAYQAEDEAEDSAFQTKIDELQSENDTAAEQIKGLIDQINAGLNAGDGEPVDPNAPIPDQSLPGDQPEPDQTLPGDLPPDESEQAQE